MVDFRELPIHFAIRHRLDSIDTSRHQHPGQKMELMKMLLDNSYDPSRGVYVPMSSYVKLKGKLTENFDEIPDEVSASVGTKFCYFANPLLVPARYGQPTFDIEQAPAPRFRATNAGFIVVTVEHDCKNHDQFAEIFGWIASTGKFKDVDAELKKSRDYMGHSVVFSGNHSLHFHFVFDTRHITKAPWQANAEDRWRHREQQSAIIDNVHRTCWDRVNEVMNEILNPQLEADRKLRAYTQWRRTPWGIRKLEKPSSILSLAKGTMVPQLTVIESIRADRASKGSKDYLVDPEFSLSNAPETKHRSSGPRMSLGIARTEVGQAIIDELASLCKLEWKSEYPKPVRMEERDGEWVIYFENHAGDLTPSTVAMSDYRSLLHCGQDLPSGRFKLPDSLTAQELGNYLAFQFGLVSPTPAFVTAGDDSPAIYKRFTSFQELMNTSKMPLWERYERSVQRSFAVPLTTRPHPIIQEEYRRKLAAIVGGVRIFGKDVTILSVEGVGKTHALFRLMALEAFDKAVESKSATQKFFCFACRSHVQAAEKASEYLANRRDKFSWAVTIKSFWQHYRDVCKILGENSIERDLDSNSNVNAVLRQINDRQPKIFEELERIRQSLWMHEGKLAFDAGLTMIFTTHSTMMHWHETKLTRIWHHPDFRPFDEEDHESLRQAFEFGHVVFDDPEIDEFVHLLSEQLFDHLLRQYQSHDNWRNLELKKRREKFQQMKQAGEFVDQIDFDQYNALRYLDLNDLEQVKIDTTACLLGGRTLLSRYI